MASFWESELFAKKGVTSSWIQEKIGRMSGSLQAQVTKREKIAKNIFLYELKGVSEALPPFSAGAHIEVQIPSLKDTWRSYSLANDPTEKNRYELAVLREEHSPKTASQVLCDETQVGSILTIDEPHNTFALDESATDFLLIAGGIGITPLRSMMFSLRKQKKPFTLVYTARTPDETAFFRELSSSPDTVLFHFSKGALPGRMDLAPLIGIWKPGKKIYCCGPESLMQAVRSKALELGWPAEMICFERFSLPEFSSVHKNSFCEVIASTSKKKAICQPGETLLQVLHRMGLDIPSSCEAGTCGTCLVDIVEGQVEPHDLFLTPEEHAACKLAISCVGIPTGPRLIIDI